MPPGMCHEIGIASTAGTGARCGGNSAKAPSFSPLTIATIDHAGGAPGCYHVACPPCAGVARRWPEYCWVETGAEKAFWSQGIAAPAFTGRVLLELCSVNLEIHENSPRSL